MDILDEYVKITITIDKIESYKENTFNKIKNARSKKEFNKYYELFKRDMLKLKENDKLVKKYKQLKRRQYEIKKILLSDKLSYGYSKKNVLYDNIHSDEKIYFDYDEIEKTINILQQKYLSYDSSDDSNNVTMKKNNIFTM